MANADRGRWARAQAAASSRNATRRSGASRSTAAAVGQLHRVRRRAQELRRLREERRAELARRLVDRRPRHVELPGGGRGAGERRERRVADVDGDVRLGHAEELGGDLHQRGRLAAADVGDAGPDQDRAVHLELHPRARPVVEPDDPPVRRERRREAPPHALAGPRGRARGARGRPRRGGRSRAATPRSRAPVPRPAARPSGGSSARGRSRGSRPSARASSSIWLS